MRYSKTPTTIVFCFYLVLLLGPVFAQEPARSQVRGKLVEIKVPAPALKGNLLGDPVEQPVSVYFPPSYDASPSKRYPVLYLLHGYGGSNRTWSTDSPRSFSVGPIMDAVIAAGRGREMIVVAPNARNAFNGSFYTNSPVTGNWEDYIFQDIVRHIDANYRTLARPASRGIAGHSMGGYGAVAIGMKHPEVFSAIYALSPCCLGMEGDFNEANPGWARLATFTSRDQLPKFSSLDDFYTNVFSALSAAFSPNVDRAPFYSDLLFREQNGKLERVEVASAKWKAKMPLYMVADHKQNLLGLRGIFLDYGQNEEFSHIRIATSLLSKSLSEHGVPHMFEIYAGGDHSNKIKERVETKLINFFSERLEFTDR